MIKFASPTKPSPLKQPLFIGTSYGLAAWTTVLAVAQMVSFEDFVEALRGYHVTSERGTLALAVVLLAFEVFSVPFLLRLWLSPAARFVSALFAILSPLTWVLIAVAAVMNNAAASTSGMLGGFVHVPFASALLVSLAWLLWVGLTYGALGGRRALGIMR